MNNSSSSTDPRHPIRVVADRTGLTPSALRAWERRYGVVEPGRSEGGQRLYADADVERLLLLRRVTEAGRAISSVADLTTAELQQMDGEDRAAHRELAEEAPGSGQGVREPRMEAAFQAVEALDPAALERLLRREVVLMGGERFLEELVAPLLWRIGESWRAGDLRPAQEHVAVAVVKQVVGWMLERSREGATGKTLVVGTLTGERHELGALLAATVASMAGWRVVFLGEDLPPEEIALTARTVAAAAVGISVVNPVDRDGIPEQLRSLVAELPAGVAIFLGGASAVEVARVTGEERIVALPSLDDFRTVLLERG